MRLAILSFTATTIICVSCGDETQELPTDPVSLTATPTATAISTPVPDVTPSPTSTPSATPTTPPSPTPTQNATTTPSPTPSPTPAYNIEVAYKCGSRYSKVTGYVNHWKDSATNCIASLSIPKNVNLTTALSSFSSCGYTDYSNIDRRCTYTANCRALLYEVGDNLSNYRNNYYEIWDKLEFSYESGGVVAQKLNSTATNLENSLLEQNYSPITCNWNPRLTAGTNNIQDP